MVAHVSRIVLIVAAICGVASAAAPGTVRFSASALNDSVHPGGRGDSVDVRSDTRDIRAFTVRYTRGVRGRIPQLDSPARAIAVTLATGPGSASRVTGRLVVPAGADRGRVRLTSTGIPGLRATFRSGGTPQLRVTGLPAQTHSVGLVTIGRGRDMLRNVGRCVDHVRRDTNVIDVTFADGSRSKTNRNRVACGY